MNLYCVCEKAPKPVKAWMLCGRTINYRGGVWISKNAMLRELDMNETELANLYGYRCIRVTITPA